MNDTFTVKKGGVLTEIASVVKDVNPGSAGAFPTSGSQLVNVSGTLYFTALKSGVGWELWKSNGTAAGTVLVKDIVAGSGSSNPAQLNNVNGTLFFTAETATHGRELWKSNGTAAGTVMVKDIRPGSGYGFYFGLTDTLVNVNGTLFFTTNNGVNGVELWKTNGTAAGMVLVKDITPGASGTNLTDLTSVGGKLFFRGPGTGSSLALWVSNGTSAGTLKLAPNGLALPGLANGSPLITDVNGVAYFRSGANDLWKSDGTVAGTVLVKTGVQPQGFTNVNGTLFFTGHQVGIGHELMTVGKVNVLLNDRDPEGKPLTAVRVSGQTKGTLTLNTNGTFTYRPNAGFTGTDSFTYRASDGVLQSNLATVTITVTA